MRTSIERVMASVLGRTPLARVSVALVMLATGPVTMIAQTVDTIIPGDAAIDASVILAHVASWKLIGIRGGSEQEIATFTREIDFVTHSANEPAILARWHFRTPQRSGLDIYYMDPASLVPFARYVTSPQGMWVQYQDQGKLIATLTRRTDAEPLSFEATLEIPRFNNAMLDLVLASLPLDVGYAARWPTVSTSTSMEQATSGWTEVSVSDLEEVVTPNGSTVRAWVVDVLPSSGNRQRVWITVAPPYLLRRDVFNATGDVTARWEVTGLKFEP